MPRKPSPTAPTLKPKRGPKTVAADSDRDEDINPGVNPAVPGGGGPWASPDFPIVAIGASAGGLEAFRVLLAALPTNTGMAFVLVQHLWPSHESLLSEILGRATGMHVSEVSNNMPVKPNHVYVIPPGKSMVLGNGLLQLAPRTEIKGIARPVDHFMRSLAEEHGHLAIGVVLSGTGNDGTLGIQEIKSAGGITFAQDDTADQPGMPESAVASGAVDFVLAADAIAHELARISQHPLAVATEPEAVAPEGDGYDRVIRALGDGTDVDFTHYKKNTLFRRIARRMLVRRVDTMESYAELLQGDSVEVQALYQDVLINVTSFFRNPDAYEALKSSVFPKLIEEKGKNKEIRVWALGCSTGEEAYSLAMAFTEYLEESGKRATLQVFATDLNATGIDKARAGVYPKGIAQDVSPERLRRFFVDIDGAYRIAKPIRDTVVFARQNLITDPPFSRLDLIACRNMLIYLEPAIQLRLIPLLHFALRDKGFLWLGSSETIGSYRHLFQPIDPKHRIYLKKPDPTQRITLPVGRDRSLVHPTSAPVPHAITRTARDPFVETDQLLLARYAPPAVVVDAAFDVVQFRGDASDYLAALPGKASLNLLKMLPEGLLVPIRAALYRAQDEGKPVRSEDLRVKVGHSWREVDVIVLPLGDGKRGMAVVFEEPVHSRESRAKLLSAELETRVDRAETARRSAPGNDELDRVTQELAATRQYLQSVIEQQEAVNEELQSANEEAQSANEELQSINEELETSKEEIQSSNEELVTLNDELNSRNAELAIANGDLLNLMSSVQMAIVIVGLDLRIRRFTPMAEKNMGLIAGDLGRPIGDIRTTLTLDGLDGLVSEVVDTATVSEREVQDRAGRWYSLRARPYRTLDNRIDGAVLVLVDIDDLKRTQATVLENERRFELLANSTPVPIWVADLGGIRFVNRAFENFVGAMEADVRLADHAHYVHPGYRDAYRTAMLHALQKREPLDMRLQMRRGDGTYRWVKAVAAPTFLPDGQFLGLVGCTFDVTEMRDAEAVLLELDRGKNDFMAMLAHELRNPLAGMRNASYLLTQSREAHVVDAARGIIERQSGHMVRMVDDLLELARVTHGKIELRTGDVDLAMVVRSAVDATEPERRERHQAIEVSVPESPTWIRGDGMRLEQVISNLLGNASKFTRPEGKIWISLEPEAGGWACIRVRDNGMGILPEFLGHVFEMFAQSDRSTERARTGIGVGLALTKQLIDLHGGTITAYSAGDAMGSEFVVKLHMDAPRKLSAPAATALPKAKAKAPGTGPVRKILIVDDDVDSAESMRMVLTQAGHDVRMVHRGALAAPEAERFRPDVIVLDLGLPDLDGHRVAAELRKHPASDGAHLLAVTGYGRPEDFLKSREAGIDEHFVKPVDLRQLLASIAKGR